MLAFLLVPFLAVASPTCVKNAGKPDEKPICGFSCVTGSKGSACADWPGGACTVVDGSPTCGPPAPEGWGELYEDIPKARCVTSHATTVCGYGCLQIQGEAVCAKTPEGVCRAGGARVACWDPPTPVRRRLARKPSLPKPDCISQLDRIACGYACTAHVGEVGCAQTPEGVCQGSAAKVVCWDPPGSLEKDSEPKLEVRPECVVAREAVACGFHCVAANGKVACAQDPAATCSVDHGDPVCVEPGYRREKGLEFRAP